MADDPWAQFRDADEVPLMTGGADAWSQFADAPAEQDMLPWIEDRARQIAQGVTFRLGDEIAAGAGAAGNYVARTLGADIPERTYSQIKQEIGGEQQRFEKAHPIAAPALEIAGAVATPVAGAQAAARAAQAVLPGAGLASRIGQATISGGLTGAPTGALYGAGASEEKTAIGRLKDALKGLGTGTVTGAAAGGVLTPIVAGVTKLGQKVVQPYLDVIRGASNAEREGLNRLARAMSTDAGRGLDDAAFDAAATRGQPVMNYERGGTNTRNLARASANVSADARETLQDAMDPRFASQNDRTADFIQDLGGNPQSAGLTREALQTEARRIRDPLYRQAYADGVGGIDSTDLERLQTAPALRRAMEEARNRLANRHAVEGATGNVEDRMVGANGLTLEFWDAAKQSLDDRITALISKEQNGEARELIGVRDKLIEILDGPSGVPSYAGARGTASTYFGATDALTAGENFATAGARYRNEQTRRALDEFSPREQELFREGYVSRLTQRAREGSDRQNITGKLANSSAERERLEIALGPQRSKELEAQLYVEGLMEKNRKEVTGNSTTARQLIEAGVLVGGGSGASYVTGDNTALTIATVLAGARAGGRFAKDHATSQVATEIARQLTSKDPTAIREAMRRIAESPAMMDRLRRVTGAAAGGAIAAQHTPEPKKSDPLADALRRRYAQ